MSDIYSGVQFRNNGKLKLLIIVGTRPEESSFFTSVGHPFPASYIRTSTERPEAINKADFIIAGIDTKMV